MTEKRRIDEMIRREFAIFKKQAGKLPSKEDLGKNKNIILLKQSVYAHFPQLKG